MLALLCSALVEALSHHNRVHQPKALVVGTPFRATACAPFSTRPLSLSTVESLSPPLCTSLQPVVQSSQCFFVGVLASAPENVSSVDKQLGLVLLMTAHTAGVACCYQDAAGLARQDDGAVVWIV